MPKRGTIADMVQKVFFACYGELLDVEQTIDYSFHSKTNKFKEVVMELNMTKDEFQKDQDWNFGRDRWEMGIAKNPHHGIAEFQLPDDVYKPATNYNDAVRLHKGHHTLQVPWTTPSSGNQQDILMHDEWGRINQRDRRLYAFRVGDTITFSRRFTSGELGSLIETDVIRYFEDLHICTDACPDNCPKAYDEKVWQWLPDPHYAIVRTAAKRAAHDPSIAERVQTLTDEASKSLSAMRTNDAAKTTTNKVKGAGLGFFRVY